MRPCSLASDVQTEPHTRHSAEVPFVEPAKWLKEVGQVLRLYADTRVGHRDPDCATVGSELDADLSAIG